MSSETLTSLMKLPVEVLRLRLSSANLDMTGSKKERATRLYRHLRARPPPDQRQRRTDQRPQHQETGPTSRQPRRQNEQEHPNTGDGGARDAPVQRMSGDSNSDSDSAGQLSSSEDQEDSESDALDDDDRAVHRRTLPLPHTRHADGTASPPGRRTTPDLRHPTTHHRTRTASIRARPSRSRGQHGVRQAPPSRQSRPRSREQGRSGRRSRHRRELDRDRGGYQRHQPSTTARFRSRSPRRDRSSTRPYRRQHREFSSSESDSSVDYRGRSSSPSSSSSTFSSASSSCSRSPSNSPRSRRHKHHQCHHRRRHHHKERSFSWIHGSSPFVSCAPPPSDRTISRIRRGKYTNFDVLLPHTEESMPVQGARAAEGRTKHNRMQKRTVNDFQSWTEAWNIFFLITAHTSHSQYRSLELLKYQALMGHLFSAYPTPVCVKYDQLFRRAAARDPSLQWDAYKEDLLVWCSTSRSFRRPITSRLGPPAASAAGGALQRATHNTTGKEICLRYNKGNCTRGDECRFAHCCWHVGCRGNHPAKTCPLGTGG